LQQVQAMLRLSVEGEFDAANTTDGQKAALARATAAPTFEALVDSLRAAQQTVHGAFDAIVTEPAAKVAAAKIAAAAQAAGPERETNS
jgi:hypothetical protein